MMASNTNNSTYQFLPELLPEEYEALKASIAERGVDVRIVAAVLLRLSLATDWATADSSDAIAMNLLLIVDCCEWPRSVRQVQENVKLNNVNDDYVSSEVHPQNTVFYEVMLGCAIPLPL